jgi:hypothetical protein
MKLQIGTQTTADTVARTYEDRIRNDAILAQTSTSYSLWRMGTITGTLLDTFLGGPAMSTAETIPDEWYSGGDRPGPSN